VIKHLILSIKKGRKEEKMIKKATKTQLQKMQKMSQKFKEEAQELGLMDNYIFVRLFETYENQIALMAQYIDAIIKEGAMVVVPVGKDSEKTAVNPAAVEYNKVVTSSSKIAGQLDAMIERAKKSVVPKDEDDEL
jgi:expansin (peptidoglycan-binding protein)